MSLKLIYLLAVLFVMLSCLWMLWRLGDEPAVSWVVGAACLCSLYAVWEIERRMK